MYIYSNNIFYIARCIIKVRYKKLIMVHSEYMHTEPITRDMKVHICTLKQTDRSSHKTKDLLTILTGNDAVIHESADQ